MENEQENAKGVQFGDYKPKVDPTAKAEPSRVAGTILNKPEIKEQETKKNGKQPLLVLDVLTNSKAGQEEITKVAVWSEKAVALAEHVEKGTFIVVDGKNLKEGKEFEGKLKNETINFKSKSITASEVQPYKTIESYMNVAFDDKNSDGWFNIIEKDNKQIMSLKGYIQSNETQILDGKEVKLFVPSTITIDNSNDMGKQQIDSIKEYIKRENPNRESQKVNISVRANARLFMHKEGSKHAYSLNVDNINKQKKEQTKFGLFVLDKASKQEVKQEETKETKKEQTKAKPKAKAKKETKGLTK